MNAAMKRIMAKEIKESADESRDMIKKATKDANDNNITDAADLEALGYDKDTAEGAISILTELGIIQ